MKGVLHPADLFSSGVIDVRGRSKNETRFLLGIPATGMPCTPRCHTPLDLPVAITADTRLLARPFARALPLFPVNKRFIDSCNGITTDRGVPAGAYSVPNGFFNLYCRLRLCLLHPRFSLLVPLALGLLFRLVNLHFCCNEIILGTPY